MRRRLFNILAAGSLLLGVVTAGLWVRSYWASDAILWDQGGRGGIGGRTYIARASRGRIWIAAGRQWSEEIRLQGFQRLSDPPAPIYLGNDGQQWFFDHIGFACGRVHTTVFDCLEIGCPHWFLCAAFLVWPALHIGRAKRIRQRRGAGLCKKCGYDLRASRETCPECGTAIPADVERRPVTDGVKPT